MVRVDFSDAELPQLRDELEAMLEFAATLERLDVEGTREWTPPPPAGRTLRADTPTESLPRDEALALAPTSKDGYFVVPRTLDQD